MNKCILIGNLARDPELRTTQTGLSTCTMTLAVNRRKNKDGVQEADFITVVAWRQLADLCAKYLTKGRKCAVVGSLQTRSYEAKDGSKRYVTEVLADNVEFLSPASQREDAPAPQPSAAPAYNRQTTMSDAMAAQDGFVEVNDDKLPF